MPLRTFKKQINWKEFGLIKQFSLIPLIGVGIPAEGMRTGKAVGEGVGERVGL